MPNCSIFVFNAGIFGVFRLPIKRIPPDTAAAGPAQPKADAAPV
jgi:hypothetical protein